MLVSIIITNFNYQKYIHRCIRSCLRQSLSETLYEIIVIDDNSTDDSINILKSYERFNNIKILKNKKNLGVAASANKAIKKAKGKYFVRLDADDYINRDMIKFMTIYIQSNNNIFGVACDYFYINKFEKKIRQLNAKENPIACGILYDRKLFIKYGMYNPYFRHREEEELRIRLKEKYKIAYLGIPFYRYRLHQNNKTQTNDYAFKFKDKIEKLKNNSKKIISKNIAIVIPARLGSKRFKNKNIFKINNNRMINIVINEARKIQFNKTIFVSTENNKIKEIVKANGVQIINRPKKLSGDKVNKIDVIRHAATEIKKKFGKKFDLILSLQANSPTIKSYQISECINKLFTKKLDEVMSINDDLLQNAAIRVFKFDKIFSDNLGTNCGFVITNTLDIHYKKDLKNLKFE